MNSPMENLAGYRADSETQGTPRQQAFLTALIVKWLCLLLLGPITDLAAQQQARHGAGQDWEVFSSIGWRDLQKGDDQPVGDGMDIGIGIGFQSFRRVGFEIEVHGVWAAGTAARGTESSLTEKGYWTRTASRKNDDRVLSLSGNVVISGSYNQWNVFKSTHASIQPFALCGISILYVNHRQTFHLVEQGIRPEQVSPTYLYLRTEPDQSSRFEPGLGIGGGVKVFTGPRVFLRIEVMNLMSRSYSPKLIYPFYLPWPNRVMTAIGCFW